VRALEAGALVVEDELAHVLAAATPPQPDGVWSPFVRFEVDASVIRLATIEGAAINCTSLPPP
jgi:hypothetical protein